MTKKNLYTNAQKLSIWIYPIAFGIIYLGSHISLLARHDLSVSDYYLPTAFSVVLIYWFGPKFILPVVYINAVCTSYLWGNSIEHWPLWFLFAIPETLFAFLSWFLFRVIYRGKYWLPNINSTVLFLGVGVLSLPLLKHFCCSLY